MTLLARPLGISTSVEAFSSYSEELGERPHCLVLTKTDLLGPGEDPPVLDAPEAWGVFTVSSVARTGLQALLEGLWAKVREVIEERSDPVGDDDWGAP